MLELLTGTDGSLHAEVSLPTKPVAGVVTLHPASNGSRDYFLFRHLASIVWDLRVAVLRFDRRRSPSADDVHFEIQEADARAAVASLRAALRGSPVGVWAFSQGTWPAISLASEHASDLAFMVLVGAPATTPAEQMRYATRKRLEQLGFERDLGSLERVRATFEASIRGELPRGEAQTIINRFRDEPWFPHAWVPSDLVDGAEWHDIDFDPRPLIPGIRCPTLLILGAEEEVVPVDRTIDVWENSAVDVTTVLLPEVGHVPTRDGSEDKGQIVPRYTETIRGWIGNRVKALAPDDRGQS